MRITVQQVTFSMTIHASLLAIALIHIIRLNVVHTGNGISDGFRRSPVKSLIGSYEQRSETLRTTSGSTMPLHRSTSYISRTIAECCMVFKRRAIICLRPSM
jgi:hypothetical protein